MELGHILTAQVIILSSLISTMTLTENSRYAHTLRNVTSLSWIKVSGEKGALLFLLALSSLFLIAIDFISSQARVAGFKRAMRRMRKAKQEHTQCLILIFITFISAYIFQSLNFRTSNLLGVGIITMNLSTAMRLWGLELPRTWMYLSFVFSVILVFGFTFVKGMEQYYSIVISYMTFK